MRSEHDAPRAKTVCRVLRHAAAIAVVAVLVMQVVVVLASWVATAVMPDATMRSLLSADALRWLFGQSVGALASQPLVWLLMVSMAAGAVWRSCLWAAVCNRHLPYRQRMALRIVAAEVAVYAVLMALLTLVPHAMLLSVTGSLWPSSFSASLVPQMAVLVMVCAVTYGLVGGTLHGADGVLSALTAGIERMAPLFVLYLLLGELWLSVAFVLD